MASLIGLDRACSQAEWVVTGEGQYDHQTHQGKVPWEVARCARASGAKVALVCGRIRGEQLEEVKRTFDLYIDLDSLCQDHDVHASPEELLYSAGVWLRLQVDRPSGSRRK